MPDDHVNDATLPHTTRPLKATPWNAFISERSIGMNCEVTVGWDDKSVKSAIVITVTSLKIGLFQKKTTPTPTDGFLEILGLRAKRANEFSRQTCVFIRRTCLTLSLTRSLKQLSHTISQCVLIKINILQLTYWN